MTRPLLRSVALAAALCFGASLALAQPTGTLPALDAYLDALETNDRAMGSLYIARAGRPVYARAVGYAVAPPAGDSARATPNDQYRVGSITKSYTATMVMQLVEAGRLAFDDTLARHFPDIAGADAITVEQLLRHRSGIHNLTDDPRFLASVNTPTTRARLLALLASYEPDFAPGERFAYSNSNYLLLGFLVEDHTGLPYAAALDSLVLRPLALKRTSVGDTLTAGAAVAVGPSPW